MTFTQEVREMCERHKLKTNFREDVDPPLDVLHSVPQLFTTNLNINKPHALLPTSKLINQSELNVSWFNVHMKKLCARWYCCASN